MAFISLPPSGSSSAELPYEQQLTSTASSTNINTAWNTVNTDGGGRVVLLPGVYSLSAVIGSISPDQMNNVTIEGFGSETILEFTDSAGFGAGYAVGLGGVNIYLEQNISNTTAGNSSITFSTASQAGNILEGDVVIIRGTDGSSEPDAEYHLVAADGDGGTGVVMLVTKVLRTMTSCKATVFRGGKGNSLKNLTMRRVGGTSTILGVSSNYSLNTLIENVVIEDFGYNPSFPEAGISADYSCNLQVKNCFIRNVTASGIRVQDSIDAKIEGNIIENACIDDEAGITINKTFNSLVENNNISNCVNYAINTLIGSAGTVLGRRAKIINNTISRIGSHAFRIYDETDCTIADNHFTGCGYTSGGACIIVGSLTKRLDVLGNEFRNSGQGIRVINTAGIININDNIFSVITPNEGISLQNTPGKIVINGNSFYDMSTRSGIDISATSISNTVITNNIIDTTGALGHGIYANGTGDKLIISNNAFLNIGGSNKAIYLETTMTNCLVSFNQCNGFGMTDNGTGNLLFGNNE